MNIQSIRKIAFVAFSIFFCLSCERNVNTIKNNKRYTYKEKVKLRSYQQKIFSLDSSTFFYSNMLQFSEKENCLMYYNEYSNAIYFYDYETSKLKRKLTFDIEGPNGVGSISGFLYLNNDSIFLMNYDSQRLYLCNSDKEIVKYFRTLAIKGSLQNSCGYAIVSTLQPIVLFDDKLFFVANSLDEFGTDSIGIKLSTNGLNISYLFSYPNTYRKGNWGGGLYRDYYHCYNGNTGSVVVSFPNSHDIFVIKEDSINQYYAGSYFFGGIKSLDIDKKALGNVGMVYINDYVALNPSYYGVLYDKYRDVYYRFSELPNTLEMLKNEPDEGKRWSKQASIIVLDKNFCKIGETKLSGRFSYFYNMSFVSPEGLNIGKRSGDEDVLMFDVFKLVDIDTLDE